MSEPLVPAASSWWSKIASGCTPDFPAVHSQQERTSSQEEQGPVQEEQDGFHRWGEQLAHLCQQALC